MSINKPLIITLFGGSNTFMGGGYSRHMRDFLQVSLRREVELRNEAMGNTFSHYGLFRAIRDMRHVGADVIIIEYAINDQELLPMDGHIFWRRAFEGMLRRVSVDNPSAVVCVVILYTGKSHYKDGSWRIAKLMERIANHYGAHIFDSRSELHDLLEYSATETHRDLAHYSPKFQKIIGERLANSLANLTTEVEGVPPPKPLFNHNYSNASVLGVEQLKFFKRSPKIIHLSNSRTGERAICLFQGDCLKFNLKGELLCLVTAATKDDGILRFQFDKQEVLISAFRKALTPPNHLKWPFLITNIVPAQAARKPLASHTVSAPVEIKLLKSSEEKSAIEMGAFTRGSSANPDPNGQVRSLNIIAVVVDGYVSEGEFILDDQLE